MTHLTALLIAAGLAVMNAGIAIADVGAGIALAGQRLESRCRFGIRNRAPGRLEVCRLGLAILFNTVAYATLGV